MDSQPTEVANIHIDTTPYKTIVTSAGHSLVVDEPENNGGCDEGMNPTSLLLASLGSCTAITLRMYVARKMWVIESINIRLELFKNEDKSIIIKSHLSFKGELSNEQRHRLIQIADACPIHKLLQGKIAINTQLA